MPSVAANVLPRIILPRWCNRGMRSGRGCECHPRHFIPVDEPGEAASSSRQQKQQQQQQQQQQGIISSSQITYNIDLTCYCYPPF